MTNDDVKLKNQILADNHPKLSNDFFESTFHKVTSSTHAVTINKDGSLNLFTFIRKHQFLLIGFLLTSALVMHQGHQKYVDEELLHIDTLSLSSFSVL